MANIGALSICSLLLSALVLPNALAAEYTLMPSPQTVHVGYFSAALKPVLTINSGDIVTIESVGGPDPADVDASGVVSPSAVPEHVRTIRGEVTDRGPGPHILTGPVYINGAMPGDVLEVRILDIDFAVPYRRGGAGRCGAGDTTVLRGHGCSPPARNGQHQQRAARRPHRQHRQ